MHIPTLKAPMLESAGVIRKAWEQVEHTEFHREVPGVSNSVYLQTASLTVAIDRPFRPNTPSL